MAAGQRNFRLRPVANIAHIALVALSYVRSATGRLLSLYFYIAGSISFIRNHYSFLSNGRLLLCVPLSLRSLSSESSIPPDSNSTSSGTCRHCVLPSAHLHSGPTCDSLEFRLTNICFLGVPPQYPPSLRSALWDVGGVGVGHVRRAGKQ